MWGKGILQVAKQHSMQGDLISVLSSTAALTYSVLDHSGKHLLQGCSQPAHWSLPASRGLQPYIETHGSSIHLELMMHWSLVESIDSGILICRHEAVKCLLDELELLRGQFRILWMLVRMPFLGEPPVGHLALSFGRAQRNL